MAEFVDDVHLARISARLNLRESSLKPRFMVPTRLVLKRRNWTGAVSKILLSPLYKRQGGRDACDLDVCGKFSGTVGS